MLKLDIQTAVNQERTKYIETEMLQQKIQDLAHEVHQKPPPLPPLSNNSMLLPNQLMVNETSAILASNFINGIQNPYIKNKLRIQK